MAHPRYAGAVIDCHCHFDVGAAPVVHRLLDSGRITVAVNVWDLSMPPVPFGRFRDQWLVHLDQLGLCHMPLLADVGRPGFGRALVDELRLAKSGGAVGLKLWKNLGLRLTDPSGALLGHDDPRLVPLWQTAGELDLPIVIHAGDPAEHWLPVEPANPRYEDILRHPEFWYGDGAFPELAAIHDRFEAVVAAHPDTTFIAAHFGSFMELGDVRRMLDEYPNYHVDTAAALQVMGRSDARETVLGIFASHADKILFGTDIIRTANWDMPTVDDLGGRASDRGDLAYFYSLHWQFFETAATGLAHPLPFAGAWSIDGLDLDLPTLERLYHANAQRVFGLG